jgi:parallel beta-helix repeat protein
VRILIPLCLAFWLSPSAWAGTYYVSGRGSDRADGKTSKTAFRTLQHAADLTEPGDIVYAMNGTYSIPEGKSAGAVLAITRSGTADKWITYKAMPGQTPQIVTKQWNGVNFGPTAAYVELNGFRVTGNNDNIDRDEAIKRADTPKPAGNPAYDGNCIAVDGRKGTATQRTHHIRILNNTVSKCGGGGVATLEADYVTISGNTIYDCSWYSIYGTSGISTLESWNSDDSTDYKMIITRNRLFGNKELVWWEAQGKITDGEAIIIDTLRSPNIGTYKGRTLVADNVIYDNGSAAIDIFRSDHVDVLNNSTYENVTVPEESGRGELNLNDAGDIHVLNNVFVSSKGQHPVDLETGKPCECMLGSNIYFGGENAPAKPGDLFADPQYLSVDVNHPWTVDLEVGPNSPAVNSGVETFGGLLDFAGRTRSKSSGWERGAFVQSIPMLGMAR